MKPEGIASRALTLSYFLGAELPEKLDSLQAIADHCGLTKQALSKSLMKLRDASGVKLCLEKLASSRESYRQSTLRTVENGTHYKTRTKVEATKSEATDIRLDAVGE